MNKCGFLRTSNRINVLLSRAQYGMYIIGNSNTAQSVRMWYDVLEMLREDDNFGTELPLQCARHPDDLLSVRCAEDFVHLAPEGGCTRMCNQRLRCGHSCINRCHSSVHHDAVVSLEPCPPLQRSLRPSLPADLRTAMPRKVSSELS